MKNKEFRLPQLFAEDPADGQDGELPKGQENGSKDQKGKDDPEPPAPKSTAKYSDEDFDRMFNQKFAKMMEKHEKEMAEATRLAEMNAQERAEHENKKLQEQVQELMRKEAIAEMSKSARAMLREKKISIGDNLLGVLISEDADQTKKSVEEFINLFQEAVNKAVKDALKGEPPKAGGASKLTKEQILAVKDRTERQRLIQENMRGAYVPMSGDVAQTFALMADSTGLVGMTHSINSRDASVDTLLMSCVKFFPEFEDGVFIGTIGNGTGA